LRACRPVSESKIGNGPLLSWISPAPSGSIACSWGEALSGLGRACIEVMGLLCFVGLVVTLLMALWRLQEALWPSTEGKESPERTRASLGLWDREIDG
jgi:hypothetical protein